MQERKGMENTLNLIVPFNMHTYRVGLFIMPLVMGILYLFFIKSYLLKSLLGVYIAALIKVLLGIFLCLFLAAYINGIFLALSNTPAAILSSQGIWVKNFGLIPWQDINDMSPYVVSTTPIVNIGIRVKDISKLSGQASFAGKCAIFWSKIFAYPPVVLSNLALENDYVLGFAQRFMKQQE